MSAAFSTPDCSCLVLAAGKGTRMHSDSPKVLQTLLGEPMLAYVLKALEPLFGANIFVVAGHKAEMLIQTFPASRFIIQREQLGTGHALMTALPTLETSGEEYVLVVNGDTPLLHRAVLENFLAAAQGSDIAFISLVLEDPSAYGRVVRKQDKVRAIIEAKDYDIKIHGPETGEVNAGIYLLRISVLRKLLPLLDNANKSGEYYLTDLIKLGSEAELDVRGISCGSDPSLFGINSPRELSFMEEILRGQVANELLDSGVILHGPQMARISPFVVVEPGTEIFCPCEISGQTVIKKGSVIESGCMVRDSLICEGARVRFCSHLEHASVGPNAIVGPFARLRPGAILEDSAHVGNFVELKKTRLGEGSKANHLTYLGDSEIGAHVNIGAGTITCNYDGKNKFRTEIGENAFIGSNTSLVAPVSVGAGSLVGAGSVITKDVPGNELAIARSRQKNLPRKIF